MSSRRVRRRPVSRREPEIERYSLAEWMTWVANNGGGLGYNSSSYTVGGKPAEKIPNSYTGYAEAAYGSSSVVGACMRVRRDLFGQARFTWRELTDDGTGALKHDDSLSVLERPWPNGTTGGLLAKMITDADLCGTSFVVNEGDRLRWRRPDWMYIVLSGDPLTDYDVDIMGYIYTPGGEGIEGGKPYLVDEVCQWSPIPYPGAEYIGMSWMMSALKDIQGDKAATDHKLSFFTNGATLGPIYTLPATLTADQFKKFRGDNETAHTGTHNAYKAQYIGGGATVTLAASTFQQLELKATQGANETRIAAAAGVHPAIVGLSEGLAGSTLNSGNFSAARRLVADITLISLWQSACAALQTFVEPPDGYELWIRERAIPFLREDAKDAADIFATEMETVTKGVREGFTPDSAKAATQQRNVLLLEHSGLMSVQLQPPGSGVPGEVPGELPAEEAPIDFGALRSDARSDRDDDIARALTRAIEEIERRFDPSQPRVEVGEHGGEWTVLGMLRDALKLGDRIELDPDEQFVGSDKVAGDSGTVRLVSTTRNGQSYLRIGVGDETFGSRDDEGGPWRGGPDRTGQINADRDRLREEFEALEVVAPLTPAQQQRYDELDDMDLNDAIPGGYTARLDSTTAERFRTALAEAVEAAAKADREDNALYDRLEDVQKRHDAHLNKAFAGKGPNDVMDPADADEAQRLSDELAAIRREIDALDTFRTLADASVRGEWADLHYRVYTDDPSTGPQILLGAVPHDNPDVTTFDDLGDSHATLDVAEARRLIRLLSPQTATRARYGEGAGERVGAGFEGGGRFRSLTDRLTALLTDWNKGEGPDDPLDEFNREQLRKTAKSLADKAKAAGDHDRAARLTPRRGASSDEIKLALYKDMRSRRDAPQGKPEAPKPRKAATPAAPKSDLPDDPEALRDALDLHKVQELKDMLREQGLPVSGRKRELVDRLVEHQATDGRAPVKPAKAEHLASTTVHDADTGGRITLEEAGRRMYGDREYERRTGAAPRNTGKPTAQSTRADVAEQVAYFARLIRDGHDPHDRETTPKLDRIAAGLTDGSLSNADASEQLAALADEYAGSASGDNLRNWSRALAPEVGPEQKSRIRQAEIDKARGVAEVAAEVHELIGNETDPDAMRRSLRSIGQRHGVDTAHLQDLADDPTKLREAADEMAKAAKLTRIGSVTEPVSFDRKQHEGIAGPLRDGQSVEVVRPGYSARLADGEQVQISKAKVEAADHTPPGTRLSGAAALGAVPRRPRLIVNETREVQ